MNKFSYNDGGRKAAGFQGVTGDCAARALAIAAQIPYRVAYDKINEVAKAEKIRKSDARKGVHTDTFKTVMADYGWTWVPTSSIGSGCKVHLRADELPHGRIICRVSKHFVAVVDGVVHDTHDCARNGTRMVYGYWRKQ